MNQSVRVSCTYVNGREYGLAGMIGYLSRILFLLLAACSSEPAVVQPAVATVDIPRSYQISVVSHGWHTGLIVPGVILNAAVPELKRRFIEPTYYEIGWGDEGFYQAQEITMGLTLQALFWSKGSILHVVALPEAPEQYFVGDTIVSTCLAKHELTSLQQFLAASFAHNKAGAIKALRRGIYGDSEFYLGQGHYYFFNTCNKWTAKALRSAGVGIDWTFKLTAGSVMEEFAAHHHACSSRPEFR